MIDIGDRDIIQTQIGENIINGQDDWKQMPDKVLLGGRWHCVFYRLENDTLRVRGFNTGDGTGNASTKVFEICDLPEELKGIKWNDPTENAKDFETSNSSTASGLFFISDDMLKVSITTAAAYSSLVSTGFDLNFTKIEKES